MKNRTFLTWFALGHLANDWPIGSLWLPLLVLAVMAAVVFTASTLRFRRDLAPSDGSEAAAADAGVAGS